MADEALCLHISRTAQKKVAVNRQSARSLERTLLLAQARMARQGPRNAQASPASRRRLRDGPTRPLWVSVLCLPRGREAPEGVQDSARGPKSSDWPQGEASKVPKGSATGVHTHGAQPTRSSPLLQKPCPRAADSMQSEDPAANVNAHSRHSACRASSVEMSTHLMLPAP